MKGAVTQLGISFKPPVYHSLNVRRMARVASRKIELTVDKWAKDLTSVSRKKKTVAASPVLRRRRSVSSFLRQ